MTTHRLDPSQIAWPVSRLGELVENLARRSGYMGKPMRAPQPPAWLAQADSQALNDWLDTAAGELGVETEPVHTQYDDLDQFITGGGPAILRLPGAADHHQPIFLAVLKGRRGRAKILRPDLQTRWVSAAALANLITAPFEAPLVEMIDQALQDAGVPPERQSRARQAILRTQLGAIRLEAGWLLRLPPSHALPGQFRHAGVYRPVWILLVMYFLQQIISLASWYVIGRGIFSGRFDMGWLLAWGILLLSSIPVQIIVSDAQSELSMGAGMLFKQRLMSGALKLDPEEIRHQGMGQFLNRVMESEAVEMLALSGGFTALLSVIELGLAFVVLSRGAGGAINVLLLAVWVIAAAIFLWRYAVSSRDWSDAYREMTNHIVEEMVGHRTRLAQEDLRRRHTEEDQELERYLKLSEAQDTAAARLTALITRGWMLAGLTGIALAFIGQNPDPAGLAIGLGGVLLASQGLNKLASGAQSLSSLFNAWRQVGPLFKAAQRPRSLPALGFTPPQAGASTSEHDAQASMPGSGHAALLQTRDVVFRYYPHGRAALENVSLSIYPGDRLLLEGPSGGGKSTLGAVLTGLRLPESGSMLLWGFDRQLLGQEAWRKRVVMAPQFQENHVFTETFAFNLLMGRRWPPEQQDLADAEAVCRELGLGELLERMPSGFQQMLGESGWQLSHGERSRLFIARTLLQQADLIVLDESFGALDPENLQRAMQCVLERAKTVLVIAHP